MGTRNLVGVKYNGVLFGQYGQWDGYPDGQGVQVFSFIKNTLLGVAGAELDFREHFKNVTFLSPKQVDKRWEEAGADGSGFADLSVANRFKAKNGHLSRDCGAKILNYILENEKPELFNSADFGADSLFCEWAWFVDLDEDSLLCFRGFNKDPASASPLFTPFDTDRKPNDEYYPIVQVQKLSFDQIHKMTKEDFLKLFVRNEEE